MFGISVCNFQSMKSPVELLNSPLLTFSYYISQAWYKRIENIKTMKKIMPTDRSFLRAWKMMRTKDFIDGCLKLKAVAKIFPSMLPAYKFHSCSYRLYSLLVFLISKCYSISLSNILVLRQHIGVRLKDCCERLLLMSLSFYHTLADSFLSSLLSIQAFLNI